MISIIGTFRHVNETLVQKDGVNTSFARKKLEKNGFSLY